MMDNQGIMAIFHKECELKYALLALAKSERLLRDGSLQKYASDLRHAPYGNWIKAFRATACSTSWCPIPLAISKKSKNQTYVEFSSCLAHMPWEDKYHDASILSARWSRIAGYIYDSIRYVYDVLMNMAKENQLLTNTFEWTP